MSSLAVTKGHKIVLGCILCAQLLMPAFGAAYYRLLQRPALIAQGATPCQEYKTQAPAWVPIDCDVAVSSRAGDALEERYVSQYGSATTIVRSHGDEWQSTETSYAATKVALAFPFAALVVGAIAVLHKVARTGAISSWQLARHPADAFERILGFYSVPVLLLGIAMLPLTQYLL